MRRTLGAGAYGVVYGADDPLLGRRVAVKVLAQPSRTERVVAEARALARVSHPNVIAIYDVGSVDGLAFIAMEQIAGVTLRVWQRGRTRREVVGAYLQAGEGLAAVHAAGLVHRDFKPDNVLVGGDGRVRLVDFGIAHDPEAVASVPAGTPLYMAPEQHGGAVVDARADQFSFCVALAIALTGRHPFGEVAGLRERVVDGAIDARTIRALPEPLRAAVVRGLRADPEQRHPRIEAVLDAVRDYLATEAAPAVAIGGEVLARRRRRARTPIAGAIAVAAVWIGAQLWHGGAAREPVAAAAAATAPPVRGLYGAARVTWSGEVVHAAVLSPNDREVAFLDGRALVVQALRVGAAPRVVLEGELRGTALAWSPDGTQLAVVSRGRTLLVDAASGEAREIAGDRVKLALLGGDELASISADDRTLEIARFSTGGGAAAARMCRLPEPFTLVRRFQYHAATDAIFVQLDHGDRRSSIVRIARGDAMATDGTCRARIVAGQLDLLSFALRTTDARLFVRRMQTRDLEELDDDARTVARYPVQSDEYELVGVRGDGSVVHVSTGQESVLYATGPGAERRELVSRLSRTRFAPSPDRALLAYIDGLYRTGVLRIGRADAAIATTVPIATRVANAAWSPDGKRLGILFQGRSGYELGTWDRATGALSPRRAVTLAYDIELTWLDNRRLALARLGRSAYDWIDVESGAKGEILDGALGDGTGERFELAAGPRPHALAFLTLSAAGTHVWRWDGAGQPRRTATIAALSTAHVPPLPRLAWLPGEAGLVVYTRDRDERWLVRDGAVVAAPAVRGRRRGEQVNSVFPARAGEPELVHVHRPTGDLYVSRPVPAG